LIDFEQKNCALGAKLTGAGGGGSVFAITLPENYQKLISSWEEAIFEKGLTNAQIYYPKISRQGLIVDRIENIE
jgi:mevalonate kinase